MTATLAHGMCISYLTEAKSSHKSFVAPWRDGKRNCMICSLCMKHFPLLTSLFLATVKLPVCVPIPLPKSISDRLQWQRRLREYLILIFWAPHARALVEVRWLGGTTKSVLKRKTSGQLYRSSPSIAMQLLSDRVFGTSTAEEPPAPKRPWHGGTVRPERDR